MIATPSRPAGWVWELLTWIGLFFSLFLNIYLFTTLIGRIGHHEDPSNKCAVARQARVQKQMAMEKTLDVNYPDESGHLSHVVIPIHNSKEDLAGLTTLFAKWSTYPPCTHNSYPSNWSKPFVKLVLLLESDPSREFAEELRKLYRENLPTAVRSCFASIEVRHAALEPSKQMTVGADFAAADAIQKEAIEKRLVNDRAMFQQFLANRIGLDEASYSLYLTLDCLPIQPNWLNHVDYETRPPIEHYWVKGSIYRGKEPPAKLGKAIIDETNISDLLHIGKCALYHIGDPALGTFYTNIVLPWLQKLPLAEQMTSCHQDLARYLLRLDHYEVSRELAALFRFSEFVQDHTDCEYDLDAIRKESPTSVLIKGLGPAAPVVNVTDVNALNLKIPDALVPNAKVAQPLVAKAPLVPGAAVPGAQVPNVGGAQIPNVGGVQVPNVGGAQVPNVLGAQVPNVPGAQIPNVGAPIPNVGAPQPILGGQPGAIPNVASAPPPSGNSIFGGQSSIPNALGGQPQQAQIPNVPASIPNVPNPLAPQVSYTCNNA